MPDIRDEIFAENVAKLPGNKKPAQSSEEFCRLKDGSFTCTKPKDHDDTLHCSVGILGYVHHEWTA